MITLEQLRTQYKPQILELAKKHGVENIRVFGSVARGDADEKSDVDFLYSLVPPNTLWEACGMQYELERLLQVKVDFVSANGLRPAFKSNILSEAIPL